LLAQGFASNGFHVMNHEPPSTIRRSDSRPIAVYREYLPCSALQAHVYAFFSFVPGPLLPPARRPLLREIAFCDPTFCSPQFADGHVSMVFELGRTCDADGCWNDAPIALRGTVTGPMTSVGRTEWSDRAEMIGVYFKAAGANAFVRVAISELTDTAVAVHDLWGSMGAILPSDMCEMDEADRVDHLESVLLTCLAHDRLTTGSVDVHGLAADILRRRGRLTVEAMARAAGVSRQHLTREFRDRIGVAPKLYCRLARFQSGLSYAGSQARIDWAGAATDMGYADQSHMIAEFRQFSGLTPQALATGRWFHPFIERARG
jgi:AraC-like DNA-binding protein